MTWIPLIVGRYETEEEAEEAKAPLTAARIEARVTDAPGGTTDSGMPGTYGPRWKLVVRARDACRVNEILDHEDAELRKQPSPLAELPWTCARCGEHMAGSMSDCWACGNSQAGKTDSGFPTEGELNRLTASELAEDAAWDAHVEKAMSKEQGRLDEPADPGERIARRAYGLALWGLVLFPPVPQIAVLSIVREFDRLPGPVSPRARAMVRRARLLSWGMLGVVAALFVWLLFG